MSNFHFLRRILPWSLVGNILDRKDFFFLLSSSFSLSIRQFLTIFNKKFNKKKTNFLYEIKIVIITANELIFVFYSLYVKLSINENHLNIKYKIIMDYSCLFLPFINRVTDNSQLQYFPLHLILSTSFYFTFKLTCYLSSYRHFIYAFPSYFFLPLLNNSFFLSIILSFFNFEQTSPNFQYNKQKFF